jgi:hypothetical protein
MALGASTWTSTGASGAASQSDRSEAAQRPMLCGLAGLRACRHLYVVPGPFTRPTSGPPARPPVGPTTGPPCDGGPGPVSRTRSALAGFGLCRHIRVRLGVSMCLGVSHSDRRDLSRLGAGDSAAYRLRAGYATLVRNEARTDAERLRGGSTLAARCSVGVGGSIGGADQTERKQTAVRDDGQGAQISRPAGKGCGRSRA